MITRPLPNLDAWTAALAQAAIPVLPGSVAELAQLRVIEDTHGTVDAHTIADNLGGDPLMTLRVLVNAAELCHQRGVESPETFVGACLMLGIGPFFQRFEQVDSLSDWLHPHPEAISGLLKVITRARRASGLAASFALRRQDEDVAVIAEAALLHDFAEMLLWCHAPELALQLAQRLAADHTLRSADVQHELLGVNLSDLTQSLMAAWHLPLMLRECTNDRDMNDPKVRSVTLAVQIARHTQHGWDDPHAKAALPDDVAEVAQLLTLSWDSAHRLLLSMDS